jgi:hypothetical protein
MRGKKIIAHCWRGKIFFERGAWAMDLGPICRPLHEVEAAIGWPAKTV